jgi:hypothetical protein
MGFVRISGHSIAFANAQKYYSLKKRIANSYARNEGLAVRGPYSALNRSADSNQSFQGIQGDIDPR